MFHIIRHDVFQHLVPFRYGFRLTDKKGEHKEQDPIFIHTKNDTINIIFFIFLLFQLPALLLVLISDLLLQFFSSDTVCRGTNTTKRYTLGDKKTRYVFLGQQKQQQSAVDFPARSYGCFSEFSF